MDPKIAKKTQDTLGKIIKKPPLTDKLLSKPPFRFLHDIVTSVVKSTGFMKGLHAESELNSENVKDKDSKIAFLQKVIDYVAMVNGKSLSAKPGKIVAGHEPEKTNELLVALSQSINKQVDNDEFLKKFKNEDKIGEEKKDKEKDKPEKKKRETDDKEEKHKDRDGEKKPREKSRDRERSKDRDGDRKDKDKDREKRDKSKHREDREDRHKEREDRPKDREERSRDKDEKHRDKEERHRDKEERHKDREERHKERRSKKKDEEGKENESPDVNAEKDERIPRPTSAKGSRRRRDDDDDRKQTNDSVKESDIPPQIAAARKQARPSSARPAPPRPKADVTESEPAMRLGTGKPTNLIVDDDKESEDDDDNFLVEDSAIPPPEPEQPVHRAEAEDEEDHGGLVKKMLETKKELDQQPNQSQRKVDIERSAISDAARRKQREQVQKEIDKLRSSIQSLTRSANPLGKIMDYVQEDLDSMQQELEKWKTENKEHALALKREKGVTDRAVEPLKAQLSELDQAIKDQLEASATIKSNVIKNDQKIDKMLKNIART